VVHVRVIAYEARTRKVAVILVATAAALYLVATASAVAALTSAAAVSVTLLAAGGFCVASIRISARAATRHAAEARVAAIGQIRSGLEAQIHERSTARLLEGMLGDLENERQDLASPVARRTLHARQALKVVNVTVAVLPGDERARYAAEWADHIEEARAAGLSVTGVRLSIVLAALRLAVSLRLRPACRRETP
jgi:hypothetical protein